MQPRKITRITKLKVKHDRYDLTINKTHNFFANSMLIHNTSVRIGNAYVKKERKWYHKLLRIPTPDENQVLIGTRRVIIGRSDGKGYIDHNMYKMAVENLTHKLNPGEAVYGEIVGWIEKDRPLFNRGGVIFKYGCPNGEQDFYVYNIVWTLPNGESVNLSWEQIKARCAELGVKHVPEMTVFGYGKGSFVFSGNYEALESTIYAMAKGPDPLDESHIREGVVVRVDYGGKTKFLKCKSEDYLNLEDAFKTNNQIDIEETM